MANDMSLLVDKIYYDILILDMFTLDEGYDKDSFPDIIKRRTIPTFSRFFPHKMIVNIDTSRCKGGYYLIDDAICRNVKILGIGDIDWTRFARRSGAEQSMGYGAYDFLSNNYGLDDVGLLQMRADQMSMFNNGIYLEFERPNRVKLVTVNNQDISRYLNCFPLEIYVEHFDNLSTISPTMMETFEDLATADVATVVHGHLKYADGKDTAGFTTNLQLEKINEWAERRGEIVNTLRENHISAGNKEQHLIYVV